MSAHLWRESVPSNQATSTQRKLADERNARLRRLYGPLLPRVEPPPPPPPKPKPDPMLEPPRRMSAPQLGPVGLTARLIAKTVAAHYGMSRAELLMETHMRHVVRPRQIAMFLSLQMARGASLSLVGRWFGRDNRKFDHTTVMHARDTIADMIESDREFAGEIETLRQRIIEAAA
jgi:hypothetical protein